MKLRRPLALAALMLAVGCAPAGAAKVTGMDLTHYPWVDSGITTFADTHELVADQGLLDAFARQYANRPHPDDYGEQWNTPDAADFFLYWLPNQLYNIAAGVQDPPPGVRLDLSTAAGLRRGLWLDYLAGFYSGVWERVTFAEFEGPGRAPATATDAELSAAYDAYVARPAQLANNGTDAQALAYVYDTLRGPTDPPQPTATGLLLPWNAEVPMFGFDAKYAELVLPPNPAASQIAKPRVEPYFDVDDTKLLTATYGVPEQPHLQAARQAFASVTSPAAKARLDEAVNGRPGETPLLAEQDIYATALGGGLYGVGIQGLTSYRKFNQAEYDNLLAWNTHGVMINHAAGLNALAAYANQDAELARRQIRSHAMWWLWTYVYTSGGSDPYSDGKTLYEALPKFTYADESRPGPCAQRVRTVRVGRSVVRVRQHGTKLKIRRGAGGGLRVRVRFTGRQQLTQIKLVRRTDAGRHVRIVRIRRCPSVKPRDPAGARR